MQKFLTENVLPLLQSSSADDGIQINKQKLQVLQADLKIFLSAQIKIETAGVNKQLAKKSRQLFILSSDNQSLKQTVSQLQTSIQSSRSQYSALDQQKTKQKLTFQKQINQLNKQNQAKLKQRNKQITKLKNEIDQINQQNSQKIREIKKQNKIQLDLRIENQRKIHQQEVISLKLQFQQQKEHIIKDNNDTKKQLIRKYQDKINTLTSQYEDRIYLLDKDIKKYNSQATKIKGRLQEKVMTLQNQISKLKSQLNRETSLHHKFQELYKSTNSQLMTFQSKASQQKQIIQQELHETKKKLYQEQRKYIKDTNNLSKILENTILEKDKKYIDTVEIMNIQNRTQVDSLRNQMIEERQIAVNTLEVLRQQQNYANQLKYTNLQQQYQKLHVKNMTVSQDYQQKIKKLTQQHDDLLQGVNMRRQYQLNVSGLNCQRQMKQMKNMHDLQIKSLHQKYANQLVQTQKKNNQQKLGLNNKLTTQYQSMISDIKNSNQIQIKQKMIQFDRKSKGYDNKLKQSDKKKIQIKSQMQRVKLQMQMRIDSMLDVTEALEDQITSLNQKLQDFERQKQVITGQYQLKILMLRNQMKQTKDQFETRQQQLKQLLESKLKAKNQEISLMTSKLKKQTNLLIDQNNQRVKALELQYSQLKRVLGEKTSLPEDIQALKIFHAAYLEKQQEVNQQKRKVQYLRRQLMAKDAIDKVFAEKGQKIIFQIDQQNTTSYTPYKSMNQFNYSKMNTQNYNNNKKEKSTLLGAIKSTQLY